MFIEQVGDDKYITKTSNEWQALLMYDSLLTGKVIEVGNDKCFDELKIKISSDKRKDNVIYLIEADVSLIEVPEPLFRKQKWMFDNGYDYVCWRETILKLMKMALWETEASH